MIAPVIIRIQYSNKKPTFRKQKHNIIMSAMQFIPWWKKPQNNKLIRIWRLKEQEQLIIDTVK